MAEKTKVYETKVKHAGVFDWKEVYTFLYTIFGDFEYDVEEKNYTEKTKGDKKEIEVHWITKRKISDYFRFQIKMDILILGMATVEVVKDGIKTSANKGELEIKFAAFLEKDYENRWENTAFIRFLRGVYDKYIIKSTLENYEDRIIKELIDISEQTKAFLALTSVNK